MDITVDEIPEPVGLYDPFVHAMVRDPYPLYRELRDHHPAYYNPERDLWAVSRFEDVQHVARDWRTFANSGGADIDVGPQWFGVGDFVDSDPPRHERLRGVVKNSFSPRATAEMEGDIRRQVDELLAPMLERGHGELVGEFASVIPLVVIFNLLGYPREDLDALKRLLYAVQLRTPGATEPPEAAVQARGELHAYIEVAAAERRRIPRDDLLTHIVESEKTGGVSREEIPGMAVLLMIAGWETSSILITNAIWLLARHPEQRERLRKNPDEIPAAVEEVLRFDAPVQHLARLTLADATLHDQTLAAGSRVLLLWASANRDERRWEDPDRFDTTREPQRNLAFGEGIHHCLGAPLARLESRVVLEALLARDVEFEVGEPGRLPQVIIRGISDLPIRFG